MLTLEVGKRDMPILYAMPETIRVRSTFRFAISHTFVLFRLLKWQWVVLERESTLLRNVGIKTDVAFRGMARTLSRHKLCA